VSGGDAVDDGARVSTNSSGYFTVNRSSKTATYRFAAFSNGSTSQIIGTSRAAKPQK
jgi:hypothetical protein